VRTVTRIIRRPLLFAVAVLSMTIAGTLIPLSAIHTHILEQAWISISADYRDRNDLHDVTASADHYTRLGGFDIYQIARHQNNNTLIYDVSPLPDAKTQNAIPAFDASRAHSFLSWDDTVLFLVSKRQAPIILTGQIDGISTSFIIEKSHIFHDIMDYALVVLVLVFLGLPVLITAGLLMIRRAEQRPMADLIKTIHMMADDPTVTQPIPESIRKIKDFDDLAQALELLQLNMVRILQHRERLAEIGEGVAKINHDIRNVLSSATLVSDALMASDDDNVRKSAPFVMRSLEQAVDLCQSMLDYLKQAPTPTYVNFDLMVLLEEVKDATSLEISYSGPRAMYADRGMMYRILLNLGRNAGTAGATALNIDVWRVGHLAIFDISDNGAGIPRDLWPTLFSPFKSRQSSGGGLGLTIARDLALSQDAILKLSRSSEAGSEFRIQFNGNKFPELQSAQDGHVWPTIKIRSGGMAPA